MKLRLHSGSLRLRLGPSEVQSLMNGTSVFDSLQFGPEPWQRLRYGIEITQETSTQHAEFSDGAIVVRIGSQTVRQWGESDAVAIDAQQSVGEKKVLQILIEKDFACLHGETESDDVFANPVLLDRAVK